MCVCFRLEKKSLHEASSGLVSMECAVLAESDILLKTLGFKSIDWIRHIFFFHFKLALTLLDFG